MRTTERIWWLLIGTAVGAGVAMLYAPRSGKETRRFIRRRAEDAKDTLVETGENLLDTGKDVYKKGVSAAAGAADLFDRGRRRMAERG